MWFTPRALLLHLTVLTVVPTFLGLAWWQLHRALGGNDLSWAYTFEWPFFAGYGVFVWWKLVHDQPVRGQPRRRVAPAAEARPVGWALGDRRRAAGHRTSPRPASPTEPALAPSAGEAGPPPGTLGAPPPTRVESESEEDRALAEYNEYLAALAASGRQKRW